jgi:hypothetical protein
MPLFKKKEVKTEEQKKQDLKDVEPNVQDLNVGVAEEQHEVTLDEIIGKNPSSWYKARLLEQINDLNSQIAILIEEIRKK